MSAESDPPDEKAVEPELPPWLNEPKDINGVLERYHIEAKVTGRLAGTTLFLVQAKDRSGKCETCQCEVGVANHFFNHS